MTNIGSQSEATTAPMTVVIHGCRIFERNRISLMKLFRCAAYSEYMQGKIRSNKVRRPLAIVFTPIVVWRPVFVVFWVELKDDVVSPGTTELKDDVVLPATKCPDEESNKSILRYCSDFEGITRFTATRVVL